MTNISRLFKVHRQMDPLLSLFIAMILTYSLYILWSASGQNIAMMQNRVVQILMGIAVMVFMAQLPPRFYEKWAVVLYFVSLILLLLVDLFGEHSKGAQRWLNLGIVRFQPSEIAKLAIPLMAAKFLSRQDSPLKFSTIIQTLAIIGTPTVLVALEPDLGTSILIASSGLFILFLSGLQWQYIIIAIILGIIFAYIMWAFLMHDYQRERVLTLIDPYRDRSGKGYHIIQSTIAIGSGGLMGKGYLQGTQSQLEFIPERHTDFIFSVIAEELGFLGALFLIFLYLCLIIRGLVMASQSKTMFGRILIGALMLVFFLYIFINIGMVSGILPVVGVPLPLISYGGTSLLVLMSCFGVIMSIHSHNK